MSYKEYNDLYLKSQNDANAPYLCLSLDLVDSKKMSIKDRCKEQLLMINTMQDVFSNLECLEKQTNQKILLSDKNIVLNEKITGDSSHIAYYNNPCILAGDFRVFYVYNNSIAEDDFISIFTECAKNNELYFKYHYQSAKFETTEYKQGCDKYYMGYCVGYLQNNKASRTI